MRRVAASSCPTRVESAISIVAILITAALGLVNPLLLKLIIDGCDAQFGSPEALLYVSELMIILPIIAGLIGVGQTWLNTVIGQRVMSDLREQLYESPPANTAPLLHRNAHWRDPVRSLSNDVGGIPEVKWPTPPARIVSNLAIANLDGHRDVAAGLASGPALAGHVADLRGPDPQGRSGAARGHVQHATLPGRHDTILEETLSVSGVLLTKAFGRQAHEIDKFRAENEKLIGFQIREQMIGRWFFMIIGTFF